MPNFFNCLKKYIRCCLFLTIDAVLFPQLRSFEIVDPRNLNDSTCLTTVLSIKSWHIGFLCFRKSIVISQVLETFNTRLFFPHQSTILWTSSLYAVSFAFSMQPINVASSENLIKWTDWSPETQSFVNRVNKKGDNNETNPNRKTRSGKTNPISKHNPKTDPNPNHTLILTAVLLA